VKVALFVTRFSPLPWLELATRGRGSDPKHLDEAGASHVARSKPGFTRQAQTVTVVAMVVLCCPWLWILAERRSVNSKKTMTSETLGSWILFYLRMVQKIVKVTCFSDRSLIFGHIQYCWVLRTPSLTSGKRSCARRWAQEAADEFRCSRWSVQVISSDFGPIHSPVSSLLGSVHFYSIHLYSALFLDCAEPSANKSAKPRQFFLPHCQTVLNVGPAGARTPLLWIKNMFRFVGRLD
jgi:hypothetical protein